MDPRLHKKLTQDGKLGQTGPSVGRGSGLGHIDRRPPSPVQPPDHGGPHTTIEPQSGLGMTNPTIAPQLPPPSPFTPGGVLPHVSKALSGPSSSKMGGTGGTLKKVAWWSFIIGSGAAVFYGASRLAGPKTLKDRFLPELDDDEYED